MRFPAQLPEFFPSLAKSLAVLATLLFAVVICSAQTKPAPKPAPKLDPATPAKSDESADATHLLAAMGKLEQKFQEQVKLPSPRTESHRSRCCHLPQ